MIHIHASEHIAAQPLHSPSPVIKEIQKSKEATRLWTDVYSNDKPLQARAAASRAFGRLGEADLVGQLDHGRDGLGVDVLAVLLQVGLGRQLDSGHHVAVLVARAAVLLLAGRLRVGAGIALQAALGLGAVLRLAARPGALGSRAGRLAHRDSGGADSLALGRQADVLAERAATSLAVLAGATHLALGALAANVARRWGQLLTTQLAVGFLALRFALSRARGAIAVPCAIREARVAYRLKAGV